ncbi:Uu.00g143520.m01.CDS01 [Anthostomella pinea]|uniref:Uu.00g143520.m01.CDS01 n=1 Tax=Anthostomella pinea TaxID=933095 RepID=A0AAI8VQM7_9PEZI|nr:Uu.00g143520.m01.CDS01 [Anthostomella pinea]
MSTIFSGGTFTNTTTEIALACIIAPVALLVLYSVLMFYFTNKRRGGSADSDSLAVREIVGGEPGDSREGLAVPAPLVPAQSRTPIYAEFMGGGRGWRGV